MEFPDDTQRTEFRSKIVPGPQNDPGSVAVGHGGGVGGGTMPLPSSPTGAGDGAGDGAGVAAGSMLENVPTVSLPVAAAASAAVFADSASKHLESSHVTAIE